MVAHAMIAVGLKRRMAGIAPVPSLVSVFAPICR
jgi:hypothetical protein